jgi:hypothetical protein
MQNHEHMKWLMLEQMVFDTYEGVEVAKDTNVYGLLTNIRIRFRNTEDAMHFALRFGDLG